MKKSAHGSLGCTLAFFAISFLLCVAFAQAQPEILLGPVTLNTTDAVQTNFTNISDTTRQNRFLVIVQGATAVPRHSFRLYALVSRGGVLSDTIGVDTVNAISDTMFDVTNKLYNYVLKKSWFPTGVIVDSTTIYSLLGKNEFTVAFGIKPYSNNSPAGGKVLVYGWKED